MTLEEMYVVSRLTWSELPYEEYITLLVEKLTELEKGNPEMYDVYWKELCHVFICNEARN